MCIADGKKPAVSPEIHGCPFRHGGGRGPGAGGMLALRAGMRSPAKHGYWRGTWNRGPFDAFGGMKTACGRRPDSRETVYLCGSGVAGYV